MKIRPIDVLAAAVTAALAGSACAQAQNSATTNALTIYSVDSARAP